MAGLIMVSYDIPDDRRRTRLAHALKDFGERVQYSVFECRLDLDGLEILRSRLLSLADSQEDSIRIYRLCEECASKEEIHGPGRKTEDPETYIL